MYTLISFLYDYLEAKKVVSRKAEAVAEAMEAYELVALW